MTQIVPLDTDAPLMRATLTLNVGKHDACSRRRDQKHDGDARQRERPT